MSDCPSCGAGLGTPLVCEACGVLSSPEREPTPFEALGLPIAYEVDAKGLKSRLLRLSRLVHPDFHGTADAGTQELAERASAAVNAAYEILSDDFLRADWLVKALGGPSDSDEREMPQEFLMEVLEWNEALDDARSAAPGSPARDTLDGLESTLHAERAARIDAIASSLVPPPESGAASLTATRLELNAVRYIDRALEDIRGLRLEQAAS